MRAALLTYAIAGMVLPTPAAARDTFHDISVESATQSDAAAQKLLDVPFYMAGQSHPPIASDMGVVKSNRRTNAFNKSKANACRIAFLSAIIAFQKRARALGGQAIVDIRSVTKHNDLDSPTRFRCVAGSVIANVALTGRVVTLR